MHLLVVEDDPRLGRLLLRLLREDRHVVELATTAEGALDGRDRFGDRVVIVTYEDLVTRTEQTMERLAARLGFAMSPSLLTPTFNGRPIRANSSYVVEGYGILRNRTQAYRSSLDDATLARVDELAGDVYERACAAASP